MSKNKAQFQNGTSLPDFMKAYGNAGIWFSGHVGRKGFDAPIVAMTNIVKSKAAIVSNDIVAIAKPRCFQVIFTNKRSYH